VTLSRLNFGSACIERGATAQAPSSQQTSFDTRNTGNQKNPKSDHATMNAQTAQLQEQARAAYKRKDYTKAVELFSRAIGRSPSLQLHDNRAACHEKLDDLPAALKDAKKSIQLGKEDPTGYVRAGRILAKMEKKSVALEIYAHGLKSVKHAGQGYEVSNPSIEQNLQASRSTDIDHSF
jgi:tetratricopeptide (TPR) repeat protein